MRNSLKRQINEIVTRIDFPMIVYLYKTGRIIALNNRAEQIIGHNVNNVNKIWAEESKFKLTNDILNNGSLVFNKKCILNKKDYIFIDVEISSIALGDEHLIVALFEQSYKKPFHKNNRKMVPILLWRDKNGKLVGYNTLLEKDMERSYIEKRYEEIKKSDREFRNVIKQYKQLLTTQESQFDIIQQVIVQGDKRCFAKLNRIALTNKNNTIVGAFTIYTLMLENEEIQLVQDDIQRENNILEKAVSRSEYIAVSFRIGKEGTIDYISPNISKWGYTCEDFYDENLTFKSIIINEDYPVFRNKNSVIEKNEELSKSILYRIRKKNGDIIWVKDETIESTIINGMKYRQGILCETLPSFLNEKTKGE